jgi:hypothetical protein
MNLVSLRPQPDLWLKAGRTLRLIEAKLPGDRMREGQLAGFAVFASLSDLPLSLEVAWLHPEGSTGHHKAWVKAEGRFFELRKALSSEPRAC